MLEWFVEAKVAAAAIRDPEQLIDEENVEVRPEKLPDAILDENVDVHLIRKFFTTDAWLLVIDVLKQKQRNQVFTCKCCHHDSESPSVLCDHCLSWFHMKCVGLKQGPKAKYWFCRSCHNSPYN